MIIVFVCNKRIFQNNSRSENNSEFIVTFLKNKNKKFIKNNQQLVFLLALRVDLVVLHQKL